MFRFFTNPSSPLLMNCFCRVCNWTSRFIFQQVMFKKSWANEICVSVFKVKPQWLFIPASLSFFSQKGQSQQVEESYIWNFFPKGMGEFLFRKNTAYKILSCLVGLYFFYSVTPIVFLNSPRALQLQILTSLLFAFVDTIVWSSSRSYSFLLLFCFLFFF